MRGESEAAQVALMLHHARNLLSVGVTTARDLGSPAYLDVAVREAIVGGIARGPRLVVPGPPITITGGHCWVMGGEADSADEVRTMVRRHHKHGTDLIKVMVTGGNMTTGSAPWQAQFDTDVLRVIVEEAHRVGKKVAAHAHAAEGIRRVGVRRNLLAHPVRSEEHTSELQSRGHLVCRLLLEKKNKETSILYTTA